MRTRESQLNEARRIDRNLQIEAERELQRQQDEIIIKRAKQDIAFIEAQRQRKRKRVLSGYLLEAPIIAKPLEVPGSFIPATPRPPVISEFGVSSQASPLEVFFAILEVQRFFRQDEVDLLFELDTFVRLFDIDAFLGNCK